MMHRRQFLASLSLGVGSVAGCISSVGSGESDSSGSPSQGCTITTPSKNQIPVSTNTNSFVLIYPPNTPVAEIVVGEEPAKKNIEPKPAVGMRIQNETTEPVGVTGTLSKGTDSPAEVFSAECELRKREDYFAVALLIPAHYELRLETDTGLGPASVPVRRSLFGDEIITYWVNITEDGITTAAGGGGGGGAG